MDKTELMKDVLKVTGIAPIIAYAEPEQAVPAAKALVAGGLPVVEVLMRNEHAMGNLEHIARDVPEIVAGAGTIITLDQAKAAGHALSVPTEELSGAVERMLGERDRLRAQNDSFLSEPMDVTKYGVVYGGVQKNIGPAGVVIAIIREDLITDDVLPGTPTMLKWKTQADADSLYNTPPCYNIYICGKVFKWIKKMGGLSAMKEHNEKKAKILYDFLDESKLFMGTVVKEDRSLMNVPFVCNIEDKEAKDAMEAKFIKEAAAAGFVNLKGHRTVGGMRASIYNAMPIEGVEKLVEFMKKFEKENA